ncbi:MAG: hypothetical protein IKZ43_03115 [Acidaminococcaceae bacterium]|nr:hypothetical protein [Acidaminococcaceae bacterium]
MKFVLLLIAVILLFVVAGCEGKGNGLNILPKNSASESRGKNPGGTGQTIGKTVTLYAEPSVKAKTVGTFPEGTSVILKHKKTTETEGIWIEIKRKEESGWVQGWVKSESIKFNWKEDSLDNLIEYNK